MTLPQTLTEHPAPRVPDERLLEAAVLLVLCDAADAAFGVREGRQWVTRWAEFAPSVTALPTADNLPTDDPGHGLEGWEDPARKYLRRLRPMLARVRPARLERYLRDLERLADQGIGVRTCRVEPPAPVLGGPPQPVTYTRGPLDTLDDAVIAMLGDPDATEADVHMAAVVADELTREGLTVLTGCHTRVDRAAAWAAIDAGGRPILFADRGINHVTPQADPLVDMVILAGGLVASTAPPSAPRWPGWWMDALAWAHGLIPTSPTDYGVAHLAVLASLERGTHIGPHQIAVPGHLAGLDGWPAQVVGEVADAQVVDWLDVTDPAWAARLRYWSRILHGWRTPDVTEHRHDLDDEPVGRPA